MDNNQSVDSIINKIIDNAECKVSTSNAPGPSNSGVEDEEIAVNQTQPEPNNLETYFLNTNQVEFNVEHPETLKTLLLQEANDNDETKKSNISLNFKSELLHIPRRSDIAVTSHSRIHHDDLLLPEPLPSQLITAPEGTENIATTVLYSDDISFASSESLIATDSMNQSALNINEHSVEYCCSRLTGKENSSSAVEPCTNQPPPYHVAMANDTVSVQLTPSAAPPLVLYSAPPLQGAPPTYSALMHVGPQENTLNNRVFSRRDVQIQPSAPFIAPPPPPSYAQAQGFCVAHPLQFADPQDSIWNAEPVTIICPYCNNFVVTSLRYRRSNLTHYSALALCICGCWPCCLLPYCMKSCKCVHHECPICANVVGIYSPWQVA